MALATIYLADDDPAQREILSYNLEAEGYNVLAFPNGEQIFAHIQDAIPDLVILDWMMPELSGIEVCRRIKKHPDCAHVPVIFLSARSEESDRLRGFEIGADDYVVKPYSISEVMARIKSNLRRIRPQGLSAQFTYKDITLDRESYRVHRGERLIKLGPKEFLLLEVLIEKPNRVWTREILLNRVWGSDIHVFSRTVDVHIGRLRKALSHRKESDVIRTVRGVGYSMK